MFTLELLRAEFEAFRIQNPIGQDPTGLYDPAEYVMSLGGKRLRPLLILTGYYLFDKNYKSALYAALGVEVFHNFTLLHDDIMDSALIRRGQSTVHEIYGENAAILSGDVMMIRSFEFVMHSCPEKVVKDVMQLMIATAREICEGQQLDMDFEVIENVSEEQYLHMNKLKTAVLLGACLKIGAMIAGASGDQASLLYSAGISFGMAFQVQDDLLDAYGKADTMGKKRGGDIVNGKKTFLYTTALNHLSHMRRTAFIDLYHEKASNPEVKIQRVLHAFDELNVKEHTITYIDNTYAEGVEYIDQVVAPMQQKSILLDFVQSLTRRKL